MPAGDYGDEADRDALVREVGVDWRRAALPPRDAALCAYAEQLTRAPASMAEPDLDRLRDHGYDDVALHDLIQVVAYFNYINRIADGVHVELEPEMPPYPGA